MEPEQDKPCRNHLHWMISPEHQAVIGSNLLTVPLPPVTVPHPSTVTGAVVMLGGAAVVAPLRVLALLVPLPSLGLIVITVMIDVELEEDTGCADRVIVVLEITRMLKLDVEGRDCRLALVVVRADTENEDLEDKDPE